ncbi:MAG: hypothetical protein K6G61_07025 [Solobacterium sp.]|nr:hypothetical protein [Solobacterium sp.]
MHIFAFLLPEMSYLQKQEIAAGKENGLGKKTLLYESRLLNHEKMHEIRLALEHGVNEKGVRAMRKLHSAQEMAVLRRRLEKGELVSGRSLYVPAVLVMTAVLTLVFDMLAYRKPYLRLRCSETEIEEGSVFDPAAYILDYSMKGGTLILPHDVDTSGERDVIAVYTLENGREKITKTLYIRIRKKDPEGLSKGLR